MRCTQYRDGGSDCQSCAAYWCDCWGQRKGNAGFADGHDYAEESTKTAGSADARKNADDSEPNMNLDLVNVKSRLGVAGGSNEEQERHCSERPWQTARKKGAEVFVAIP